MVSSEAIRTFSREHGIHAVGWFPAAAFDGYLEEIHERPEYHGIAYRPLEAFLRAGRVPGGIRTVVVLVMDYFVEAGDGESGFRLSNYARACWPTVRPKTAALLGFLAAQGHRAEELDLPQRAAACRAGLGLIGRNSLFYAHGMGSYVGIASVGTDAELEDAPGGSERAAHPRCAHCGRCIAACPTGAIPAGGYRIDPLRCLSFANRHPDEPGRILPPAPRQYGRWLYGCEACQIACPLNAEAHHRWTAVVPPGIEFEGVRLPNAATVSREAMEAALESCTSPGYREYVRRLFAGA